MDEELTEAFSLTDQVAVVTGAASGIGREAAVTFARAGAHVVLADVDEAGLAGTADEVARWTDRRVLVQPTDVSSKAAVDDLAAAALDGLGRLDVWANVAAILRYWTIVEATEADVARILAVNLLGTYWGTAAAGRAMSAAGRGAIVNVASAGGETPAPTLSGYGMTKAAVMQLTRTAAAELGPAGVRVNAVSPGWVVTPMVAHYWTGPDGRSDETARQAAIDRNAGRSPLGVVGQPADIARCMLFLASAAAGFVTGQVLRPNGGVVMA
jgi:3-oxoacyl-[acyl-carrier protein] reductase